MNSPLNLPKKIFRSYDIRGIYPTDIKQEVAFVIGQAFAQLIQAKKVVVGRDARLSSPELHQALIEGLINQGVEVHDLGLVPSELIYFAVGKYGYDGGAMITASHNSKEYNGIRFVNNKVEMLPGKVVYEFIASKKAFSPAETPGRVESKNYLTGYIQHVLSFIDINQVKPLKIVIDAGNGVASTVIPELAKRLPIKIYPLFFELDGNFPSHSPNPVLPEARLACSQSVLEKKADFGILFDGDADRAMLMTEKGEWIRGDIGLLLLAKQLLKKNPGKGISYNVVCSRAIPEKIIEWGGRPLRTPVGFVNVSGALRKYDGVLGGETSAHYCFRDNYYADSGMIAFVIIVQMLSEENQTMSQLVADLNPYHRIEEYFTIDDQQPIIQALNQDYADGKKDTLDGLTVEYDDWWFNVRPSNTEPLLRLTVEAKSETLLRDKLHQLKKYFITKR
ncbi:MAG: phosphomannomutase/phosphoglucomutase [Patescibacteria group bacterium]|nr:phosphomannomutase/phosphoglucomutase [Patescibacteria group bacterium]